MNIIKKYLYHPIKRYLARYYLIILKRFFGLKVIGITGSAGKSTTKEMIASVLSQKYRVVASKENIDPVYNIPSTILRCTPRTEWLVLEMGIEYLGEMDQYLWLAKPYIGVITNIYYAHTEFLRNLETVVEEKGKLLEALPKDGYAVLNSEDDITYKQKGRTRAQLITFKGENHLAAAAVGKVLAVSDMQIAKGLIVYKHLPHRLQELHLQNGALLIDDTYNSNPLAAKRSLEYLAKLGRGKHTIAVLGDMLELGNFVVEGHKEVGGYAGKLGIGEVIGIGKSAKHIVEAAQYSGVEKAFWAESKADVTEHLKKELRKDSVCLIKGSRSLGMETIVEHLISSLP